MRSSLGPLSVVPPSAAPPATPARVSWPPPAGGGGVTGRELAERIARFHAAHPGGRIVTELVTRARELVVFRAALYRHAGDAEPAATGWAASGWGVGAGFERAEEVAVHRALGHLGFGSDAPPFVERQSSATIGTHPPVLAGLVNDPAWRALLADLEQLIGRAERHGVRARRAAAWRGQLARMTCEGGAAPDAGSAVLALRRAEQRLRAWVARRRAEPYAGAL